MASHSDPAPLRLILPIRNDALNLPDADQAILVEWNILHSGQSMSRLGVCL